MLRAFILALVTSLMSVACGDDAGAGGQGGSTNQAGSSAQAGASSQGGSAGQAGASSQGGANQGGSAPIVGSAGCGTLHDPGFACFTTSFEGADREYCVDVQAGYDPQAPQAIVLGLHGCGGSPNGAHGATAPQITAGAGRYLFVYPKAAGSCWDYNGPSDVAYVQHVIAEVEAGYCVQPGRVFADGMSSGAMMTSRLLCDGVAIGGAAIALNYACSTPRPIWLYGGTADQYYNDYILPGRDGWIATNGCSMSTTPLPQGPCVEYQGCTQRTIWCNDDQGHVWPSDPYTAQIVDLFDSVP